MSGALQAQLPDLTDKISSLVISILSILTTLLYRMNPALPKASVVLILTAIIVLNYLIRQQLNELFGSLDDSSLPAKTQQQQRIRSAIQKQAQLQHILDTYLPQIEIDNPFPSPMLKTFNIVFLDLKNFTQFSSDATLSRVTELINQFYQVISLNTQKHNGQISAFLGDGAMLLFTDTGSAVRCVLDIIGQLPDDLQLCAGLHKGQMAYGCFGKQHCSFTVIGDAVNTASRVEASTRVLGCQFLCSNSISWHNTRFAGVVDMKGKGPMDLYEICDDHIASLARQVENHEKLMQFQAAAEVCKKALQLYKNDRIFIEKYKNNLQRANQFVIDLPNIDELGAGEFSQSNE